MCEMTSVLRKLEKACQSARGRGNRRELANVLEEFACELSEVRQWERVVEVRTELVDILKTSSGETLELARCHRYKMISFQRFYVSIQGEGFGYG